MENNIQDLIHEPQIKCDGCGFIDYKENMVRMEEDIFFCSECYSHEQEECA